MKLSEIGNTLREIRVAPVKTLGQNFLHDQNLARWMVQQAEFPRRILSWKSGRASAQLPSRCSPPAQGFWRSKRMADWRIFCARTLPIAASRSFMATRSSSKCDGSFPAGPVKLLGNLPYYASTQLLLRYLDQPTPITVAVLMLQKEVAARLSAAPRSKDYGILTLVVQSQCRVEYLRTVPASVFLPQPDVDSAFVRLTPRAPNELAGSRSRIACCARAPRIFSAAKTAWKVAQGTDLRLAARRASRLGSRCRREPKSCRSSNGSRCQISSGRAIPRTKGTEPPTEPFAVVDEMDRVIGAAPRREVHGNNLRHRAVHIFIFNRAGEAAFAETFALERSASRIFGTRARPATSAPAKNMMPPPCASCARNWA